MKLKSIIVCSALAVAVAINCLGGAGLTTTNQPLTAGTITTRTPVVFSGGTNIVTASFVSNLTTTIDISDATDVGVTFGGAGLSATTATSALFIKRVGDGVNPETPNNWLVPLTLNGTTPVFNYSNLVVGAEKSLMVSAVSNAAAVTMTNVYVAFTIKYKRIVAQPAQ